MIAAEVAAARLNRPRAASATLAVGHDAIASCQTCLVEEEYVAPTPRRGPALFRGVIADRAIRDRRRNPGCDPASPPIPWMGATKGRRRAMSHVAANGAIGDGHCAGRDPDAPAGGAGTGNNRRTGLIVTNSDTG